MTSKTLTTYAATGPSPHPLAAAMAALGAPTGAEWASHAPPRPARPSPRA